MTIAIDELIKEIQNVKKHGGYPDPRKVLMSLNKIKIQGLEVEKQIASKFSEQLKEPSV